MKQQVTYRMQICGGNPSNKWLSLLGNEERDCLQKREAEIIEGIQRRHSSIERLLRLYGYKPWKREDRRNRPLRTKRGWIVLRAQMRDAEILTLRLRDALSFREIGRLLGISHVAAWKGLDRAIRDCALERRHREKCLREIERKLEQIKKLEPRIAHLSLAERRKVLRYYDLIPKAKRRHREGHTSRKKETGEGVLKGPPEWLTCNSI